MTQSKFVPAALLLALTSLCLPPAVHAEPEVPSHHTPESSELRDNMLSMKDNLKQLAMGLQASDQETVLKHVSELQKLVLASKPLPPPTLNKLPETKRAAHRIEFRRHLAQLLQELAALEIEVLDGKPQKAFSRITGALFQLREKAHEKFQSSK